MTRWNWVHTWPNWHLQKEKIARMCKDPNPEPVNLPEGSVALLKPLASAVQESSAPTPHAERPSVSSRRRRTHEPVRWVGLLQRCEGTP